MDETKEMENEQEKAKKRAASIDAQKAAVENAVMNKDPEPKMTKEELINKMRALTDDKEFWRLAYMQSSEEFVHLNNGYVIPFCISPICAQVRHTEYENPLHDIVRCASRAYYFGDNKSFHTRSLKREFFKNYDGAIKTICSVCTDTSLPICPYSAVAYIRYICKVNNIEVEEVFAELAGDLYKPMQIYRPLSDICHANEEEYEFLNKLSVVTALEFIKERWIDCDIEGDEVVYAYVDFLTNPKKSFIPQVLEFYRGVPRTNRVKIHEFKEFILTKRNIVDTSYSQEPDKVAAYIWYLSKKYDVAPMQLGAEILKKIEHGSQVYNDVMIGINRNTLHSIPFKGDSLKKADSIYNYVVNFGFHKGVPYIPVNIVIYTSDELLCKKVIKVYDWILMFQNYYNTYTATTDRVKEVSIADYSLDEITEMINSIKAPNDPTLDLKKDIKGPMIFHIKDMEMLPSKETRVGANALAIAKLANAITRKQNMLTVIISGEKEKLDRALKEHGEFYDRIMLHKIEIDDMPMLNIVRELMWEFSANYILEDGFDKELEKYTIFKANDSNMKSNDLKEAIKQEILFNHYNKGFDVDKNICIDEIPKIRGFKSDEDIWAEINSLQGLTSIKEELKKLQSLLSYRKKAEAKGMKGMARPNLHMIFSGNPGTGKTTVARLLGDILYNFGYVRKKKIVEVSPKDLIAQYVGQTAPKTAAVCESAYGGILFVDEAYELASGDVSGSNSQFRSECITELIKQMEDNRDKLVVIFAGYTEDMDRLLDSNAGFASRIGSKYIFEDYSDEELYNMFKGLAAKEGLKLSEGVNEKVLARIADARDMKDFGNGRFIRNVFEKTMIQHAENTIMAEEDEVLFTITPEDIPDIDNSRKANKKNKIGFI